MLTQLAQNVNTSGEINCVVITCVVLFYRKIFWCTKCLARVLYFAPAPHQFGQWGHRWRVWGRVCRVLNANQYCLRSVLMHCTMRLLTVSVLLILCVNDSIFANADWVGSGAVHHPRCVLTTCCIYATLTISRHVACLQQAKNATCCIFTTPFFRGIFATLHPLCVSFQQHGMVRAWCRILVI